MPTTAGDTVAWDQGARTLTLTGTNTQENVFDLASGMLAGTTDLYVNVPAGSSTVINVPDPSVKFTGVACLQVVYYWDGSAYEAGNVSPTPTVQALMANTVLNFPSATSGSCSASDGLALDASWPPTPTSTSSTATSSASSMPTR